jgi:succinyl-diaminopimelate desuccinylase
MSSAASITTYAAISPDEAAVLALIDDEALIAGVQALTRIPSVWRPETGEGEEAAARWVEEHCRQMGLETHFEEVAPGRPNVVARLRGAPGPTLLFEGHTDVVTPGNPQLWRDPPFAAVRRDGRIYGRGANDMKAGLVCAMTAVGALAHAAAQGLRLRGDLLLAAVCDEEGQMLGIKHFVDQGWSDDVSACIVCEPEENHICIEQKGVQWLRATITGVMAHGAMPLTGANSAYPAARFLTLVEELEARTIAETRPSRYLGQPSITPTIVLSPPAGHGEAQNNVMPGATEIVLDSRLLPGQDAVRQQEAIETLLRTVTAQDERLGYSLDLLEVRPPTATDPEHPLVGALATSWQSLTGTTPTYGGVPGSTDGTILFARKGIPIVTCGPGDIHIPHHVDEWVSEAEIKQAVRLYVLAAMRYLGVAQ